MRAPAFVKTICKCDSFHVVDDKSIYYVDIVQPLSDRRNCTDLTVASAFSEAASLYLPLNSPSNRRNIAPLCIQISQ